MKRDDTPHMVRVCFMLPSELVPKVERFMRELQKLNPGMRVSKADAYRLLLTKSLDERP